VTVTDSRDAVGLRRHHLVRAADVASALGHEPRSRGFARAPLISGATGSVHMGLGLCALEDGRLDLHVHSFEESFYVLEGTPSLHLDGRDVRLRPGACGVVPVGTPHAWRSGGDDRAIWIDMLAPRPRDGSQPRDTFFLGPAPDPSPEPLDVRDPRNRHLFALAEGDMNLDELKKGSEVKAPTASASMATAVLAYSGIAVKMLVDKRLGAVLSTMFMVDYQPGAIAHSHDHPFEEAYYMLEGEVDVVADGERYTLAAGDVFWTGVGCVHAFYELRGGSVRWLETSAPQPPDRHTYRFDRDWEYLADTLG